MYVVAESPEKAAEGALMTVPEDYQNVNILETKEYTPEPKPVVN